MALETKQKYLLICAVIVIGTGVAFWLRMRMFVMPGQSYAGTLPVMTGEQTGTRNNLSAHIDMLARTIGERNFSKPEKLDKAAKYIIEQFKGNGYKPIERKYQLTDNQGHASTVENIEVVIPGTDPNQGAIIVGAHYDTVADSPGANENASGVGCLLEMARLLKGKQFAHPIRLVAFTNGSMPFYKTPDMGSFRYLTELQAEKVKIKCCIALEELGYFPDVIATQHFPPPMGSMYPTMGNFVGIVGNQRSMALVQDAVGEFRASTKFPCEGLVAQEEGNGNENSDHYYFWKANIPAIMVTDTLFYRYMNRAKDDTANNVDVDKECRIVEGLTDVVSHLAQQSSSD